MSPESVAAIINVCLLPVALVFAVYCIAQFVQSMCTLRAVERLLDEQERRLGIRHD